MSKLGNVAVREAPAAEAIRRRINFSEGANVTITVADDAVNDEVDVTIAAAGATATAWTSLFLPVVDPNSNKGTYATILLEDGALTTVRQIFYMPDELATIAAAFIIIIPDGTGNIYWSADTNFAEVCADEDYQTHVDTIALNAVAVTADEVECLDISAALTGAIGGDIVGIEFVRDSEDALDTVNADVHYLGILIRGNA